MNKTPSERTEDGWEKVNVPVVVKNRTLKNGKVAGQKDYYLERSIADYYIKFCESDITREQFEAEYDKTEGDFIRTMNLEIQTKSGEWDACDENPVQSRVGEYVIIRFPK